MSWYVRYLLLNSAEIRETAINPLGGSFTDSTLDRNLLYDDTDSLFLVDNNDDSIIIGNTSSSLEDNDLFNDLLIVEKKINELHKAGKLTSGDLDFLEGMKIDPIVSSLDGRRAAITERFVLLCDRISYYMSDIFTDEGFLNHLREDRKFSREQISRVKNFISSNMKITRSNQ